MSWADKRIEEYQKGAKSTFIERRNLEHGNPVLFILLIVGGVIGIYGTWVHDWTMILLAIMMVMVGHIYVWIVK